MKNINLKLLSLLSIFTASALPDQSETTEKMVTMRPIFRAAPYTIEVDGAIFNIPCEVHLGDPLIKKNITIKGKIGINSDTTEFDAAGENDVLIGNSTTAGAIALNGNDLSITASSKIGINVTDNKNEYTTLSKTFIHNGTIDNVTEATTDKPLLFNSCFLVNSDIPDNLLLSASGATYNNIVAINAGANGLSTIPDLKDDSIYIGNPTTDGDIFLLTGTGGSIYAQIPSDALNTSGIYIDGTSVDLFINETSFLTSHDHEIHLGLSDQSFRTRPNDTLGVGSDTGSAAKILIGNPLSCTILSGPTILGGTMNEVDAAPLVTYDGVFVSNGDINKPTNVTNEHTVALSHITLLNGSIPESLTVSNDAITTYSNIVAINSSLPNTPSTGDTYIGNISTGGNIVISCGSGKDVVINGLQNTTQATVVGIDDNGKLCKTTISSNIDWSNLSMPTGGTTVYTVAVDATGNLYKTGVSSQRYKENISPLSEAKANELFNLNVVEYNTDGSSYKEYGCIAEDFDKMGCMKDTVRYNKDKEPETIHYQSLFAASIKVLQNMHKKMKELETDYEALLIKNDKEEEELNNLKKRYEKLNEMVEKLYQLIATKN